MRASVWVIRGTEVAEIRSYIGEHRSNGGSFRHLDYEVLILNVSLSSSYELPSQI